MTNKEIENMTEQEVHQRILNNAARLALRDAQNGEDGDYEILYRDGRYAIFENMRFVVLTGSDALGIVDNVDGYNYDFGHTAIEAEFFNEYGIHFPTIKFIGIMYAIGIKDGTIKCGNDGMCHIESSNPRKIMEQTEQLRRINDAVYIVSDFTQAMCEMPHDKLVAYVAKAGRKIK